MKKITKRDMYEAIMKGAQTGEWDIHTEDIVEFCSKEIEGLDKKALKAKERAAAKKAEADELLDVVADALSTEEFRTIADIAADVATVMEDASAAKITYRLRTLVENGVVEKTDMTIKGAEGAKSRRIKAYRKIAD